MRTVYEIMLFNPRRVILTVLRQEDVSWALDMLRSEMPVNQWGAVAMWKEVGGRT